jgi:WD40 repeat protein
MVLTNNWGPPQSIFSTDQKKIAFQGPEKKNFFVVDADGHKSVIPGKGSSPVREILEFTFSPDGNHIAYSAEEEQSQKQFVVVDGVEGKRYVRVWSLSFSLDGRKVAYTAKGADGSQFVVVNGVEGKHFDCNVVDAVFSPNNARSAYVLVRKVPTIGRSSNIIIDDQDGPIYDLVERPVFSPDGTQIAYVARRGPQGPNQKVFVVLGNHEGKSYERITNLIFSPNGSELAYIARRNNDWVVVRNGEESNAYDDWQHAWVRASEWHDKSLENFLHYSPNGRKFFYQASRNRMDFVVMNGREGPHYHSVSDLVLSPDGETIAYSAVTIDGTNSSHFLVIGDKVMRSFLPPFNIGFNAAGNRVVFKDYYQYRGPSGSTVYVVCDGKIQTVGSFNWTGHHRFNADDKYVSFWALDGEELLYVHEK